MADYDYSDWDEGKPWFLNRPDIHAKAKDKARVQGIDIRTEGDFLSVGRYVRVQMSLGDFRVTVKGGNLSYGESYRLELELKSANKYIEAYRDFQ